MSRPRVFVTRHIPRKGLDMLHAAAGVEVWPESHPPPYETLLAKSAAGDGLLCMLTDRIDAHLLQQAGQLKVVSQMAVGVDNIDLQSCTRRGIPVGHTPGVLSETTADFAFALLLSAARRIVAGDRFVHAGQWQTWDPTAFMGQDIHGATLGIVGFGRIGQAVARRAGGFDMRILYTNSSPIEFPGAEQRPLDALLAAADFVSLHVPLTAATQHLIGARELRLMQPTAILINTARGAVVDARALCHALRDGVIAAAALDVTDPEPIPPDDPLLSLPNCIIAPHIGSSSVATRDKMASMAAENLLAGLRGERLPYCANPEVYA